mgnify:FL=1
MTLSYNKNCGISDKTNHKDIFYNIVISAVPKQYRKHAYTSIILLVIAYDIYKIM